MKVKATVKAPGRKAAKDLVALSLGRGRTSLLADVKDFCFETALVMAQEMRDAVYKQRWKMAPLSRQYAAWKASQNPPLDPRILIAKKKYVQAIGAEKTAYGARVGILKGFRLDRRGKSGKMRKLEYWKLQRWLEYGTRRRFVAKSGKIKKGRIGSMMPARPHWRPMAKYWKSHAKQYGLAARAKITPSLQAVLSHAGGGAT